MARRALILAVHDRITSGGSGSGVNVQARSGELASDRYDLCQLASAPLPIAIALLIYGLLIVATGARRQAADCCASAQAKSECLFSRLNTIKRHSGFISERRLSKDPIRSDQSGNYLHRHLPRPSSRAPKRICLGGSARVDRPGLESDRPSAASRVFVLSLLRLLLIRLCQSESFGAGSLDWAADGGRRRMRGPRRRRARRCTWRRDAQVTA